jgi:hypothetical protein
MKLKNLATAAVCIAAIGGTAAAPAAAKNDHGKFRRCETPAQRHFRCVTNAGAVTTVTCPSGYQITDEITAAVEVDLNDNGLVCSSTTLGYADDTILSS